MPKIRSIGDITRKWHDVTPMRADEYIKGVQNPKEDWKAKTMAAAKNFELGIAAAVANKSFDKGVGRSSTSRWQDKAIKKGGVRFGPGVQDGAQDFHAGFGPYRDVISNTTLPPRYPKGDPRNIERVRAMAKALRDKKLAG